MKKLLVIQVAGLGYDFVLKQGSPTCGTPHALKPLFPALTCTAQATLRTGTSPAKHGMIANGFFDTTLRKPLFWEQSSALVTGERFWEPFRARGGTVGLLFLQQSLGESADAIISPAPIHTHGGGMIMSCYSKSDTLYPRLQKSVGRPFKLHHYWGPLASVKSSRFIAEAVAAYLREADAPDVVMTYLPGLDYDLQRFGPDHPRSAVAYQAVKHDLLVLSAAAEANGYEIVIVGDYAITQVTDGAIFPNRALRDAGLFATRQIKRMAYPDFYTSKAFAVVDHQVAMVHVFDPSALAQVKAVLTTLPGVDQVLDASAQQAQGIAHPRTGDLFLVAKKGVWFAYPWWTDKQEAPDYATHVDIHNKPGYDPCELFFGRTPFHISMDTTKIKGTHGRADADCVVALISSIPLHATSFLELTANLREWLLD
ncbi:MAG: nucleotide pyrophosphatase/phosphodiesterase family protein [bacterium]